MAEGRLAAQMASIRQSLVRWDEMLSEKRISPGGCADLLALTLLAYFME
ncbi:MAG: triphosphoribosyl-dephospho-CoA synthase [Oscillospiraceae bacterium]|nr:triphosphoribosyl-dephospho-CoA synthase [Oscillospiraceae bacterium]